MKRTMVLGLAVAALAPLAMAAPPEGDGWIPLFNGKDLSGWTCPAGDDTGIWTVKDGVIDCTPRMDVEGDKSLWSDVELGDFELHIDWRITDTRGDPYPVPVVLPDGSHKTDEAGNVIIEPLPNADSGIYLRGTSKAQVNIWCWPIGSGEVYGYRMDKDMPAEVRAGVTPSENADNPVGEWNTFVITMKGDRLTVNLNGKTVVDDVPLPGVPESGKLALQHHGGYDPASGTWNSASSLVQFRNVYYRELNGE